MDRGSLNAGQVFAAVSHLLGGICLFVAWKQTSLRHDVGRDLSTRRSLYADDRTDQFSEQKYQADAEAVEQSTETTD